MGRLLFGVTNVAALLTVALVALATFTPAWIDFQDIDFRGVDEGLCPCMGCECGLWVSCGSSRAALSDTCSWYLVDTYTYDETFTGIVEDRLPDWVIAVQAIYACGLALSILTVITGLVALWGYCYSCDTFRIPASMAAINFILLAIAVVVFGVRANFVVDASVARDTDEILPIFGWSFWMAVLSCICAFITTICYVLVRRKERYYSY